MIMNNETRIGKLIFSTALAAVFCLCSCSLKQHTPEPEPQPEPQPETVAFRATSQASWVKSTTTSSTLSDYGHNDFGVWGIARKEGASDYILWSDDELTQVVKNTATGAPANEYRPVSDAYWFSGYTYNFIAVAPYTNSGISNVGFILKEDNTEDEVDAISFDYTSPATFNVDFDLMAAVAETSVEKSSSQGAQNLTFWHLFSQITFRVKFGNDQSGNQIEGTVQKIVLKNVRTNASYVVSAGGNTNTLAVTCEADDSQTVDLTFTTSETIPAGESWAFIDRVNILPQDITDFELFIDFEIGDGDYDAYEVNLSSAGDFYDFNERYFWNITIGHNLYISLDAKVEAWDDNGGSKYPADGDDDGEIKM